MKLGCLFAFLSFCGLFAVGMIVGMIVDLLPGVNANYEGIGAIAGWLFFLVIGPIAFIRGYRRQAKRDKENEIKNRKPENLRPLKIGSIAKPNPNVDIPKK